MTFVPPSSLPGGSVSGTVAVSNFPADQLVHLAAALAVTGPLTDAQFAAHLPLTVGVSNFPASQAVTGPLTDAQLAARLPLSVAGTVGVSNFPATQPVSGTVAVSAVGGTVTVDGSAVTQPVSAASLPLPAGAATEATLDRVKRAANDAAAEAMLKEDEA